MADTKHKQGGHDVVVRTSKGHSSGDARRDTFVDGRYKSGSYHSADGRTRQYVTPKGSLKK